MNKSRLFKLDPKELKSIVETSYSIQEVLMKLNYKNNTYGRPWIKKIIKKAKIDISHFRVNMKKRKHLEEYLTNGSRLPHQAKIKIISEILGDVCSKCQLKPLWNDQYLKLQLDHINGNPFDNRIENLRVLCPNCHSQTATFGSKNVKRPEKIIKNSIKKEIKPKYTIEMILPYIGKEPIRDISKRLSISEKTIRLLCRKNNVSYPSHSDWAKSSAQIERVRKKLTGKPVMANRKHDYEKIYSYYKKVESYQKTAKKFKLDRGLVRQIVLRHKKYIIK